MEMTATIDTASASPPSPRTADVLVALTHRADQVLRILITTHHEFLSNRAQRSHGALSLAVAHAQRVLQVLETVRDQRGRERHEVPQQLLQQQQSGSSPPPSVRTASASLEGQSMTKDKLQVYMQLEKIRIDLRRVLPRAVADVEDTDHVGGGDGTSTPGRSAATTAAALRSLLHTRTMLSMELQKIDTAMHGLADSSESLAALHKTLHDVHSSIETAQRMVRTLLTVQSRDDFLLRVSAILFALAVLYVLAQRVFRIFPTTVYVTVSDG